MDRLTYKDVEMRSIWKVELISKPYESKMSDIDIVGLEGSNLEQICFTITSTDGIKKAISLDNNELTYTENYEKTTIKNEEIFERMRNFAISHYKNILLHNFKDKGNNQVIIN